MVGTAGLRTSPYLDFQDPFANGLVINPEDLPEEVRRIVQNDRNLRDGIDSEAEMRQLMQLLEQTGGDLNGLPRPDFKNLGGMNAQDMVQALIDWIQSGGPEANKKISRPRPLGTLSSPTGGTSQPTSWGGSGGGSSGGGVSGGGSTGGTGGPSATSGPAPVPNGEIPKSFKDAKRVPLTDAEKADIAWDKLTPKVQQAAEIAKGMGLTVTSGAEGHDGDGVHTSGSNHYAGDAIDVAGSPEAMARFYETMKQLDPGSRELFYDPLGGRKNGQEIGAIGGHGDHVHYAG
jgi:hypothetical protein